VYDQEVESCDFGHKDCSAARVQEEVADVVGVRGLRTGLTFTA